jgi:hypothetical protein
MSGINNYFSNNNIFNGTEIPTQGKFDVGDIVINIGENAEEEPMWMCIEAGEPGVWKVVGKVEEMDLSGLLTESKDLVGAINELFQSANNGKELIANAIGEPLNAEDTFSAMSNDIHSLLSTFKTNMMNNGVMVESSDKFKQLIDKIVNGNAGNQYIDYILNAPNYYKENFYENFSKSTKYNAMTVNLPSVTPKDTVNNGCLVINSGRSSTNSASVWSNSVFYNLTNSVDLTNATKFLITAKRTQGTQIAKFGLITSGPDANGALTFTKSINIATSGEFVTYEMDLSEVVGNHYIGLALHTHDMRYIDPATIVHVSQIAIEGIKETDVLRDSLASILQEEGVSVTEEDDMASLISKVDEEFDRQVVPAGDAVASDVVSGKTFINSSGQLITGTASIIGPGENYYTIGQGTYGNRNASNVTSWTNAFTYTAKTTCNITMSGTFCSYISVTDRYEHSAHLRIMKNGVIVDTYHANARVEGAGGYLGVCVENMFVLNKGETLTIDYMGEYPSYYGASIKAGINFDINNII